MTYIYIFNNASRAANYGVGTYIRQVADGLLACADMKVSFVDMFSEVKEYSIVDDERGCRHYQVPTVYSGMESEDYCRCTSYFLMRHIVIGEDDRLVFHFNYFQHMPLAALLKERYFDSCRIVFTVHYLGWCFELKGNKSHFHRLVAKDYQPQDDKERQILSAVENEKNFLHFADEVLVLSKATQMILADDYGVSADKMHLIYNGWGEGLCRGRLSQEMRTILFVGRLDEIKGVDYLIDAFRQIAPKYADVRLVVVGDGDFQSYLSRCRDLQGRVVFLGRMTSDEVEAVYQSAYIGVMPSFHEQCSYTAIEMMRHGIPLIGTDSTGLAEMLDATPGLRVHIDEENETGDGLAAQISSCMDLLLSDAVAYGRASDAVSGLYETRYRVSSMMQGIRAAIAFSFDRRDYTVSSDYLIHLDSRMIQLVNQCPDIDMDFYGMAGIGVYLWMRALDLWNKEEVSFQLSLILEYLIYYVDWIQETEGSHHLPAEMVAMLQSMEQKGFYGLGVQALLKQQPVVDTVIPMPAERDIIQNALKICNCRI